MPASHARHRYLQRHIEPGLPPPPETGDRWHNVLVIPAYRESATVLKRLAHLAAGNGRSLVILVLNRPGSDPDPHANADLRRALADADGARLRRLNAHTDLYLHDMETLAGPLPAAQGVGLARKTGCDIAFSWIDAGVIRGQWIHSTDADALLPPDYFQRLDAVPPGAAAAVYPFRHVPGPDIACNNATALYELRLHYYVLGLSHAASPYAYHSLGSSLAVRASAYAQVRGFPRRSGGEDFYLLNKLAKTGEILRLRGNCIALQSRHSARTPFGTGPAVARISAVAHPLDLPLFYHPACFEALRCLLAAIPLLRQLRGPAQDASDDLTHALAAQGLDGDLLRACRDVAIGMGLHQALAHCRRQGKSPEAFLRHFHQWFDGFRSLKFVHAIRDAGWPEQSLGALGKLHPQLLPAGSLCDVDSLGATIRREFGWLDPGAQPTAQAGQESA